LILKIWEKNLGTAAGGAGRGPIVHVVAVWGGMGYGRLLSSPKNIERLWNWTQNFAEVGGYFCRVFIFLLKCIRF
jgi:hypothetical protein